MREIKFRAWSEEKKQMELRPRAVWEDGEMNFAFQQDNDLIFMEFIGRKDVNGKDIYEGDVVRAFRFNETGIVTFSDTAFCFIKKSRGPGNQVQTIRLWPGADWKNDYEIIGNIYENPELLEKAAA